MEFNYKDLDYDEIFKQNEKLLEYFEKELIEQSLAKKTRTKHVKNITIYINKYLLKDKQNPINPIDGFSKTSEFFEDYNKYDLTVSHDEIKKCVTSFRKFYKFLYDMCLITLEQFETVDYELKDGVDLYVSNLIKQKQNKKL